MFTLSAILLEDRENLFQDFWTLFSISFICFSVSGFFLKVHRPNRAVPEPDTARLAFKGRGPKPVTPRAPPRNPSAARVTPPPLPEPRRAAAAAPFRAPPPPDPLAGPRRGSPPPPVFLGKSIVFSKP